MTKRFASLAAVAALVFPLLAAGVPSASAQSACGPAYRVLPGDTLFRIARTCGVPSGALRAANPAIDWDRLRIAQTVTIPGITRDDPPRGPQAPRGGAREYTIERGDTLYSIARALGVTVEALLAANPELDSGDLRIGRILRLVAPGEPAPGRPPAGEARMTLEPRTVEPGRAVTIRLRDLPPQVPVVVTAGPTGRPSIAEARGRSDRDGRLVLELPVPERARRGERWDVEAGTPRRVLAEGSFEIAQRETPPVTVKGLLTTEGATCPAMRAVDGSLYTLAGELQGYRAGDLVNVTGPLATVSTCQQGKTIEVRRIQAAR